jgi:hypothetical protein
MYETASAAALVLLCGDATIEAWHITWTAGDHVVGWAKGSSQTTRLRKCARHSGTFFATDFPNPERHGCPENVG